MKINITTKITKRVVRVNPDGTRTVISETTSEGEPQAFTGQPVRRKRQKYALIAMMVIGALQLGYALWAGASDRRAEPILLNDASCQLTAFPAGTRIVDAGGACRVENTVVVEKNWYSQRHGSPTFWLKTVSENGGKRDDTPLATRDDRVFWNRVSATERIQLLRFMKKGYHHSGDVMAFSDHHGTVLTRYNPRSGTHYNAVWGFLGISIVLTCALVWFRQQRLQ